VMDVTPPRTPVLPSAQSSTFEDSGETWRQL